MNEPPQWQQSMSPITSRMGWPVPGGPSSPHPCSRAATSRKAVAAALDAIGMTVLPLASCAHHALSAVSTGIWSQPAKGVQPAQHKSGSTNCPLQAVYMKIPRDRSLVLVSPLCCCPVNAWRPWTQHTAACARVAAGRLPLLSLSKAAPTLSQRGQSLVVTQYHHLRFMEGAGRAPCRSNDAHAWQGAAWAQQG